jgi:hypothetical protein
LLALRPIALVILVAATGWDVWVTINHGWQGAAAASLGLNTAAAAWWITLRDGWVREVAEDYTARLFETMETLAPPMS